jgi:hypothetical protein
MAGQGEQRYRMPWGASIPARPGLTVRGDDDPAIDYLISKREAVEYGERWTPETTHEWWIDSTGERHCRLVQTYHGGGGRGDDDQAEYVRRLLDMGRAHPVPLATNTAIAELSEEDKVSLRTALPEEVTHVIVGDGDQVRALRFRHYVPPPEGI